jgi:hypothetical protein
MYTLKTKHFQGFSDSNEKLYRKYRLILDNNFELRHQKNLDTNFKLDTQKNLIAKDGVWTRSGRFQPKSKNEFLSLFPVSLMDLMKWLISVISKLLIHENFHESILMYKRPKIEKSGVPARCTLGIYYLLFMFYFTSFL